MQMIDRQDMISIARNCLLARDPIDTGLADFIDARLWCIRYHPRSTMQRMKINLW
jgi:hypothetical protein